MSAGAFLLRDVNGTIQARIAYRLLDFHNREYFLERNDEWVKLDMPQKSGLSGIVDNHILFSTHVDWTVGGTTFPADSIVAADLAEWKGDPNGAAKSLVWAPGPRQTKRGAVITAKSIFVNLLDNVRGQVLEFDHQNGEWVSWRVALPDNATVGIAAVDGSNDRIMYWVTDFLTPSTLYFSNGSSAPDVIKTSPAHLGIQGGSQGGLLVGTAFTQRPDLFNAAIVQIPLFDMLRYFKIGRGASWIGEYGDPRIAEQRAWIEPYSPYQKLTARTDFPTPFYITSTADDRTHPAHGRKAAARMSSMGQAYYYYYEDMTGGHSGGVDNDQRAKLLALQNVYLMQQLMDANDGCEQSKRNEQEQGLEGTPPVASSLQRKTQTG